jgi:hypothetical protein
VLSGLREQQPQNEGFVRAEADQLLGAGRTARAQRLLSEAIDAEPGAMSALHRMRTVIGGTDELADYRLDGARILREFESSGRTYDEPQVLVLDYTVVRVFADGSTLELTHNIFRLQSEEAVDAQGEFQPPEGAEILQLHTIKQDGTRIEPDEIEGKETISLPNLAPGDYVEFEYVRPGEPPPAFPAGYLGDRFYFQSFEVPFDFSQLTVVMPESMEPVIDPRGPAPTTEQEVVNGLRVLRWTARESRPIPAEPSSVASREYLPSINVGIQTSWEGFVAGLRDVLADRDVRDPTAERRVRQILGELRDAPALRRARRLYGWVLENIENSGDVFGLAPAMLAQRNGNRARVLHYLLGLAGVPSQLVATRSARADATDSPLPDEDTYQFLLVMLTVEDEPIFLSPVETGTPFGYLPPLLRGQPGVVLAPGAPRVVTPRSPLGADARQVEIAVELAGDGSAEVEVVETVHGEGAIAWRRDLEGIPAATLEQRFEEGYVAQLIPGARLRSLRITGRTERRRPLVLEYSFEVNALGRRAGDRWMVPGILPSQLTLQYARIASRTTTQLVANPVHCDTRIRIRRPPGASSPPLFDDVSLSGPHGARFELEASRRGDTTIVERRLRLPVMRVTPAEYADFAQFCRSTDEAEAQEMAFAL